MTSGTGATPGAPTPCPRLHDCGAYVLGALDEDERRVHEAHLPTCADCSAAVAEFAGLPALMRAGASAADAGDPATADPAAPADRATETQEIPEIPVPDTLLPRLLHAISVEERRARRRVGLGLAAAAAAAVIGGASMAVVDANLVNRSDGTSAASSAATGSGSADPSTGQVEQPERIQLATEPGAPIEAYVLVEAKAWGTAFETHCTYTGGGGGGPDDGGDYSGGSADYELVAVDADGQSHVVSTWAAGGGATVHVVPASSSLALDQIRSLRLTTVDGALIASATL